MNKLTLIVSGTTRQAWNAARDRGFEVESYSIVERWNETVVKASGDVCRAIAWYGEVGRAHAPYPGGTLLAYSRD